MKIFNIILSILFFSFSVLLLVIAILDYQSAFLNRHVYESVYGIPVEKYVVGNFVTGGLGFIGIIISGFRYFDKKRIKIWQKIVAVLFVIGVALWIAGFIRWAVTGFDH